MRLERVEVRLLPRLVWRKKREEKKEAATPDASPPCPFFWLFPVGCFFFFFSSFFCPFLRCLSLKRERKERVCAPEDDRQLNLRSAASFPPIFIFLKTGFYFAVEGNAIREQERSGAECATPTQPRSSLFSSSSSSSSLSFSLHPSTHLSICPPILCRPVYPSICLRLPLSLSPSPPHVCFHVVFLGLREFR